MQKDKVDERMRAERPFGVVMLTILEVVGGLFELGIGALLLVAAGVFGRLIPGISLDPSIGGFLVDMLLFAGIASLVVGVIAFITAFGLWRGREWAWTLSLFSSIFSILFGILLMPWGIIGSFVAALRVYYLTRPHVEAFFGVKGEREAQLADIKYTLYLLRKNPLVMTGTIISLFFVVLAFLANFVVDPRLASTEGYPNDMYPFERKYMWSANHPIKWGPGIAIYSGPEFFYLGTDSYGRDLLKMMILAIPVDLYNAAIITAAAAIFGTLLGAVAGYVGGVVDETMLRITDIFFAFPGLVLALVFAAVFGRSLETLRLAILVVWWPPYVRLMRGQVLSEKEKPYVEALRALGAGHLRILFRHVVQNSIYPILVQATMDFGGVILTFSALMFLGFSQTPALPELGNLAADGYGHVFDAPWVMLFPGLTMLVISLAFNLVGDGLRDVLDPRLRR